jgi:hypothetical protein
MRRRPEGSLIGPVDEVLRGLRSDGAATAVVAKCRLCTCSRLSAANERFVRAVAVEGNTRALGLGGGHVSISLGLSLKVDAKQLAQALFAGPILPPA